MLLATPSCQPLDKPARKALSAPARSVLLALCTDRQLDPHDCACSRSCVCQPEWLALKSGLPLDPVEGRSLGCFVSNVYASVSSHCVRTKLLPAHKAEMSGLPC